MILAVDYCHKKGVANRDIKLENTLLAVSMSYHLHSMCIGSTGRMHSCQVPYAASPGVAASYMCALRLSYLIC